MRLQEITATPHPAGNRIDLRWINPDPYNYPGVRVVRREGTYPVTPHPVTPRDGVVVAEGEGLTSAVDTQLKGETVYYYALFPFTGSPPVYHLDPHNRVSAMATAAYNFAGQMYDLLPAIYHRYDTVLPKTDSDTVAEEDKQKGQLRRFLDLPGGQLDQLYSFARAMLDLYNLEKTDGRLLPLLAQWIGWQTDYRLEIDAQRNELRNAPHVYKTIGLIPTAEATVKRIFGCESRTKEFVHNVFFSNCPERLHLWLGERHSSGQWETPAAPFSLDFAYEGRPAAVLDGTGIFWLFYHTRKKGRWEIWYKTCVTLNRWSPSQPLSSGTGLERHPTVAMQGDRLWIFWDSYDEVSQRWDIRYRTRTGGQWSAIDTFPDLGSKRQRPWAVADNLGGLWLFWLEQVGTAWRLKYNRHDGLTWSASPQDFPVEGAPRGNSDLFVLFHPSDATQPLWVFWSRQVPTGEPHQTRWQIAYRVKQSLDLAATDWSVVRTMLQETPDADNREPAAMVAATGNVEVFWSSTRDGSWSIWHATVDRASHDWGTFEQITNTPYSQRDPLPVSYGIDVLLFYRSNASVVYHSTVYSATETQDGRYAGCTTVDTRNLAKRGLRGQYEDFQVYTYDSGQHGQRTDRNWYACDTIGMYLTPSPGDSTRLIRSRKLIESVLRQFLPIQVRAVFIIAMADEELVYTYDFPAAEPARIITEQFFDSTIPETYGALGDSSQDSVPEWVWMRAWSDAHPHHRTLDFTTTPIDTRFRTWHTHLEAGG